MVNRQKSRLAGLKEKLILLRIRLTAAFELISGENLLIKNCTLHYAAVSGLDG